MVWQDIGELKYFFTKKIDNNFQVSKEKSTLIDVTCQVTFLNLEEKSLCLVLQAFKLLFAMSAKIMMGVEVTHNLNKSCGAKT